VARDEGTPQSEASQVVHTDIAGRRAPQGWAGTTRAHGEDGKPATVYCGSSRPLSAEDFGKSALGVNTGNPSSGLGVLHTINNAVATSEECFKRAYGGMHRRYPPTDLLKK